MVKKASKRPWVCFGEPRGNHSEYLNEPFADDSNFHDDHSSHLWLGYSDDPDQPYGSRISFSKMLRRARDNLYQAEQLSNANRGKKQAFRDSTFPRLQTRVRKSVAKSLDDGSRAYESAYCGCEGCSTQSDVLRVEWIKITVEDSRAHGFLLLYHFNLQGRKMVAHCSHYSGNLFRFSRQDGTISPDMCLEIRSPTLPDTVNRADVPESDRTENEYASPVTLPEILNPTQPANCLTFGQHSFSNGTALNVDDGDLLSAPYRDARTIKTEDVGITNETDTISIDHRIRTLAGTYRNMINQASQRNGTDAAELPFVEALTKSIMDVPRSDRESYLTSAINTLSIYLTTRTARPGPGV